MMESLRYYIDSARPLLVIAAMSFVIISLLFIDVPLISLFSLISIIVGGLLVSAVYSFNYWTDTKEDKISIPGLTIPKIENILKFSILCHILAILVSLLLSIYTMFLTLIILFMGFAYSYPIFGYYKKYRRFKDIPIVKSFVISLGWSLGTLIPIVAISHPLNMGVILLLTFIFFQILVGTIIGDFRDIKGDLETGVKTIPHFWSKEKIVDLLFIINTLASFILILGILEKLIPLFLLTMSIGCILRYYTIFLLYRGDKPLRFIYEKINYPTYFVFALSAILGKIIV